MKRTFQYLAVALCSAWAVCGTLAEATQRDLIINREGQPTITVDNRELAQFIYLLLNNARIREVIDTITSKTVLILGPFTPERKRTLNALRVFRTFACLNSVMLR